MAKDMKETKETKCVFMKLPKEIHARLASIATDNDRTIKAEAERIIRLAVMTDGTDVPCVGNTKTNQEG